MIRAGRRVSWLVAGFAVAALAAFGGCREVQRPARAPAVAESSAPSADPTPPVTTAIASAAPLPDPQLPIESKRIEMSGKAMGTLITLAAYTGPSQDEATIRKAMQTAFDEIVRLESLMSPWRADSELSKVNAAAGKNAVPVGVEMLEVIDKARWISERSEGVFDVTFASMGKLWRFNHDLVAEVPDAKLVAEARKRIDYRRLKIDRANSTAYLERTDQKIDLGGIAKGYAVDRAAALMRAAGLAAFYVQAGGDLYIAGRKPDGDTWRVGIRDPRGPEGSFFARIPVEDHAFSTAGDYERTFTKDGKRYHHIIDPRTGFPATASRSVTIWARGALTADAIDDAVFILGPEKGLALVESIDDCGAVIVDADNKVWVSKRLEKLFERLRDPTDGS
jgi:thiamine biosynthesis lipoprotein